MNIEVLLKSISGMIPEVSFGQFQALTGIRNVTVARDVLKFLLEQNIGRTSGKSNNYYLFSESDRLRTAILAINSGADVQRVSESISWKNFESLAYEILLSLGYRARTNLRFTNPRMEIDVVGTYSNSAIVIDCKHWKRSSLSSLSKYAQKQSARAALMLEKEDDISSAVPAIVTLYAERIQFIDMVPIVPIVKFRSFVQDIGGYIDQLKVISRVK